MIDFATAYPSSRKMYEDRPVRLTTDGPEVTLRVPVREVALTGGEPPVLLYDTSGPQGHAAAETGALDGRARLFHGRQSRAAG